MDSSTETMLPQLAAPIIDHSHVNDYFAMLREDRREKGQPSTLSPEQRSRISDLQRFVTYLDSARAMYKTHPDLVTAPEMPEPYRSILELIGWGESSTCIGMGCTICKNQDEDEDDEDENEEEEEEEEEDVPLADAHSNVTETAAETSAA